MFKVGLGRVVFVLSSTRYMGTQLQSVEYFLNTDYLAVEVGIGGDWIKHEGWSIR